MSYTTEYIASSQLIAASARIYLVGGDDRSRACFLVGLLGLAGLSGMSLGKMLMPTTCRVSLILPWIWLERIQSNRQRVLDYNGTATNVACPQSA